MAGLYIQLMHKTGSNEETFNGLVLEFMVKVSGSFDPLAALLEKELVLQLPKSLY